jgi:glutamate dehydrogenase (NAD(P)+)
MSKGTQVYENVSRQFNRAAELMNLDPDVRRILSEPMNEITVNFPAILDDGRVEMFTAYRVQHNNVLGPFKGGLRFTFALGNNIGPEFDIPAPDMNPDAQIMAWILDTYLSIIPPQERQRCHHVVTGKPVDLGGSLGRDKATGQGVVYLIERWAKDNGLDLAATSYFVQGFGNVGSWTARLMKTLGAKLLAVEDASGSLVNPDGIDPDDLSEYAAAHRGTTGYPRTSAANSGIWTRWTASCTRG